MDISPNYNGLRQMQEVVEMMRNISPEDIIQFDVSSSPTDFTQEIRVRFHMPTLTGQRRYEELMRQQTEELRREVQRLAAEQASRETSRVIIPAININWDNVIERPQEVEPTEDQEEEQRLRRLGVK